MSIAIKRADIVKTIMQGNADPAYRLVDEDALDADNGVTLIKEDVERAKKLLDEAGWKMGPDGFRYKDGVKLAPKVYYTAVSYGPRVSEALQGYMRQIGIDWNIVGFDSTIAPAKMAELDYEIWTVTYSYLSAGDMMNFYFDSANIPVPNRMFWNDPQTDEWLKAGRAALNDADRAKYYGLAQRRVTDNHLWIPVMNVGLHMVTNKRLKGARPHMIHQNVMYKALDYSY